MVPNQYSPNYEIRTTNCIRCGKKFRIHPSTFRHGGGKYCSNTCKFGISVRDRFWSKVYIRNQDDCWFWLAGKVKSRGGYGMFSYKCYPIYAHRMAYMLEYGLDNLDPGIFVMHTCDTPSCCNPKHLRLGSIIDNTMDMVNKDRQAVGEMHGNSKLNKTIVIALRDEFENIKEPTYSFCVRKSKELQVTPAAIRAIIIGRTWKHV